MNKCSKSEELETRMLEIAQFVIDTKCTVRQAAKEFGISKSSAHKDLTERLEGHSATLAKKVKKILEYNKESRHIRGGLATKNKFEKLRKSKK